MGREISGTPAHQRNRDALMEGVNEEARLLIAPEYISEWLFGQEINLHKADIR